MAIDIPSLFSDLLETPRQTQERQLRERLTKAQQAIGGLRGLARTQAPLAAQLYQSIPESQEQLRQSLGGMIGLDLRTQSEKLSDVLREADTSSSAGLVNLSRAVQDLAPTQALALRQAAVETQREEQDRRFQQQQRIRQAAVDRLQMRDYAQQIRLREEEARRARAAEPLERARLELDIESKQAQVDLAREGEVQSPGMYKVGEQEFYGGFRRGRPVIWNTETQTFEDSSVVFGVNNMIKVGERRDYGDFEPPIQQELDKFVESKEERRQNMSTNARILADVKAGALPELRAGRGFVVAVNQALGDDRGAQIMSFLNRDRVLKSFDLLPPGTASEMEGSRALGAQFDLSTANITTIIDALTLNLAADIYEQYKGEQAMNYLYDAEGDIPNIRDYQEWEANFEEKAKTDPELQRRYREAGIELQSKENDEYSIVRSQEGELDALVQAMNAGQTMREYGLTGYGASARQLGQGRGTQ